VEEHFGKRIRLKVVINWTK